MFAYNWIYWKVELLQYVNMKHNEKKVNDENLFVSLIFYLLLEGVAYFWPQQGRQSQRKENAAWLLTARRSCPLLAV